MSEWKYAEENLILKDEKKNLIAENERLRETIRMMDEGKNADVRGLKMVEDMEAEIERLRAALREIVELYYMDTAYDIAKEALGNDD